MSRLKSADELLLDHALQKVIAGLAPVQQRRVALLVEAFEKVDPDTDEAGKRLSSNTAAYLSLVGNAKERKQPNFGHLRAQVNFLIVLTSSYRGY